MTTTLIVRDATLAINGAPEKKGDSREHFTTRMREVARMDPRTAEECVEVLSAVSGGEGADPEVLEALVIVALAQPALAERLSLPTVATGRRLAARLERAAEVDRTLALLEVLRQHFPEQESLERDLAQLMRRQGMVKDLVSRYYDRARKLAREGRTSEAAGWLREALQLDPSRRDAARMLRDLRFKGANRSHKKSGWVRFLFATTVLSLGVSYGVLREVRLSQEFHALPAAASGNLPALKRRLADLEAFSARSAFWHGAIRVLSERTDLRRQVAVLEEQERQRREADERAARERIEAADLCRDRGLMAVQSGDPRAALAAFREALTHGGPTWAHHAEVTRYVADLEANSTDQP